MGVLITIALIFVVAHQWRRLNVLQARVEQLEIHDFSYIASEPAAAVSPPRFAEPEVAADLTASSAPEPAVAVPLGTVRPSVLTAETRPSENSESAELYDEDEEEPVRGFSFEDIFGRRLPIWAGGITLAILVLPIVIITSAEAIRSVPQGLKEASLGVGATQWETIRHHILPYAAPGILTGTVLSLARALGEAAPLILVGAVTNSLGSDPGLFDTSSLKDRFTAMPNIITQWAGEAQGGFKSNTAAAILILMAIVLVANGAAIYFRNRFEAKRR